MGAEFRTGGRLVDPPYFTKNTMIVHTGTKWWPGTQAPQLSVQCSADYPKVVCVIREKKKSLHCPVLS